MVLLLCSKLDHVPFPDWWILDINRCNDCIIFIEIDTTGKPKVDDT